MITSEENSNGTPNAQSTDSEFVESDQEKEVPGSEEVSESAAEGVVGKLEGELSEMKDRYFRAAAELENARRRWNKERSDLLKYGNEKLLQDLLPVLDSFEKAVNHEDSKAQAEAYIEGVSLVKKQLFDVLHKHGLESIDAVGAEFDPQFHQAIQRLEGEVESEQVKDEFQRGYLLNGRLIRPAMVSVIVPQSPKRGHGSDGGK